MHSFLTISVLQEPLKRSGHEQKWMPCWSTTKELIPAGKVIFSLSEDQVRAKCEEFGPVPRHVLASTQEANSKELQKAIKDCSLDLLQSCFANPGTAPKQMSHRLIIVLVTAAYGEGDVRFASEAILSQLVEKFQRQNDHSVQAFLHSSGGDASIQAFRGKIMESMRGSAHDKLSKGGSFECRDLKTNEAFTVTLDPAVCIKELPNYTAISELGEDEYGQGKKNLGGIDAVLNGCLFQITVSQRHPIKSRALVNVVEAAGGSEGLELYFAVDTYGFTPDFPRQRIVKTKDISTEQCDDMNRIPQHLLLLPPNEPERELDTDRMDLD